MPMVESSLTLSFLCQTHMLVVASRKLLFSVSCAIRFLFL